MLVLIIMTEYSLGPPHSGLINESSARHQLTLRDYRYGTVNHMVCLFTTQLLLVFIASTHRGMARLS